MSDAAPIDGTYLDERLASIELAIAEAQRYRDEGRKLISESRKLDRDRTVSVIVATAAAGGMLVTLGGVLVKVLGG